MEITVNYVMEEDGSRKYLLQTKVDMKIWTFTVEVQSIPVPDMGNRYEWDIGIVYLGDVEVFRTPEPLYYFHNEDDREEFIINEFARKLASVLKP